jgi:hypothetical protein
MLRILIFVLPVVVAAADLPVREVVLYKHGVGFFERSGQLGPGESARLDFKAAEMNDVLKSLTLHDASGAKITGIRYDSSEPLEVRLEDFPFRLPEENPSLPGFLNQLKGAKITLRNGTEKVTGSIVGSRLVPSSDKQPERQELVLLLDSGELRTFDLSAVAGVTFPDAKLQAQLRDYLRVVADARSKDKRSVYIDSTDTGARQVTASYMIPTPVWKSTYRLIFDEKAQALLEGWAIVDNTTADDWNKVQLALVSGRPVSFVSQLYEPRYRQRPVAELPEERDTAPVVYESALAEQPAAGLPGAVGGSVNGPRAFAAPMSKVMAAAAPPPAPAMRDAAAVRSDVAMATQSREVGELFEYRFSTPVTVHRGESAMLPFLQQKIESRKLLVYSDPNAANPMNSAELTNSTGKTLDGGPITVYDGGVYAGEALMETLKAGDKRLISYGVDLGTRITTKFDTGSTNIRELHAARGVLTVRNATQETRTYTIKNVDQKAKTLIVQHEARDQYKLLSPKAAETTRTGYRFEVRLPPGATEQLPVVEEHVYDNALLITNLNSDVLLTYVQNKSLSDAARKQLQQIADAKRRAAENDAQLARTKSDIAAIERDQQRTRQNLESLNRVSGQNEQVQKYARVLTDLDTRVVTLRERERDLEDKKAAIQSEVNSLIEKMDF